MSSPPEISPPHSAVSPSAAAPIDLIDRLVAQIEAGLPRDQFESALLESAVDGLAAHGGLLWKRDGNGVLIPRADYHHNSNLPGLPPDDVRGPARDAVIQSGSPRVLRGSSDNSASPARGESGVPDSTIVILQPLPDSGPDQALLEIHQRGDISDDALQGNLSYLQTLAQLGHEHRQAARLKELEDRSRFWKEFEAFSWDLQRFWNPDDLFSHLVDRGRRLCGFDRLTLLTGTGKSCRVRMISSADQPNRRSESIRSLENLGAALTTADLEILYGGESDQPLAPELSESLQAVLNAGGARILHAVPLKVIDPAGTDEAPPVLGALVGEHFSAQIEPSAHRRLRGVATHAAPAVARAAVWESLPAKWLLKSWLAIRGTAASAGRSTWRWTGAGLILLVLALAVIPADFEIDATGRLQPQLRENIFAPADAIVREIHFDNDKPVHADQLLLTLNDPKLEQSLEEVRGEQARIAARLTAIDAIRSNLVRGRNESKEDDDRLAAEAQELRERRESLAAQLQILNRRTQQLQIKSSLSGRILTWNAEVLLTPRRPVLAGQLLVTVADLDGPWAIELQLPEDDFGHIRDALQQDGGSVPIEFFVDARPGIHHRAQLHRDQVSRTAEVDLEMNHYVPATIELPDDAGTAFVPGAGVTVRVDCGRRSLGFVLFHDLYEWLQRHVFF